MKISKTIKNISISLIFAMLCGTTFFASKSFAKYLEEYKENQHANVANFNSCKVSYSSSPISIPEDASNGIYAFVASFEVYLEPCEVKRSFTMDIKSVENAVSPSDYDSVSAYSKSTYSLDTIPTRIYTTYLNSSNVSTVTSSNVASLLTNSKYSSFTANSVYISHVISDNKDDDVTTNFVVNNETTYLYGDSLRVINEYTINPQEASYHYISVVYFVDVTVSSLTPYNMIYKVNMTQVQ